jgi:hypothetical protein
MAGAISISISISQAGARAAATRAPVDWTEGLQSKAGQRARCQVQYEHSQLSQLQNTAVRLVWDLCRSGVRGGGSVGLGGSMVVDLLEKRHATFLMEACRRHRDVKP